MGGSALGIILHSISLCISKHLSLRDKLLQEVDQYQHTMSFAATINATALRNFLQKVTQSTHFVLLHIFHHSQRLNVVKISDIVLVYNIHVIFVWH